MKFFNFIFLSLSLCLFLNSGAVMAGGQENMKSAVKHLKKAKASLKKAKANKGGHRVNAIKLIDKAIDATEAGMAHAKSKKDAKKLNRKMKKLNKKLGY